MSSSSAVFASRQSVVETLEKLAVQIETTLQSVQSAGELSMLDEETLQCLMTPLIKFYTAVVEETRTELVPTSSTVTPTEAVILACALLRAQDLNPFDLAIWFSRGKKTRVYAEPEANSFHSR